MAGKFFDDRNRLNLTEISKELDTVLCEYENFLGPEFKFGKHAPMNFRSDKNYTARTDIPVFIKGNEEGCLYVILFKEYDATGDGSLFDDLLVPSKYILDLNRYNSVFPRSKSETHVEALFPFFTIVPGIDKIFKHIVSLEELTVAHGAVLTKACDLGMNSEIYINNLIIESVLDHANQKIAEEEITPALYLTVGFRENGERFGDPHSIFCAIPEKIQVVGFLATSENSSLVPILEKYGKIPPYFNPPFCCNMP